jgi:glutamate carboxypeptidase
MHTESNRQLLAYLRDHQQEMVDQLQQFIALESPTNHKPSVDQLGMVLAEQLRQLGAAVEILPQTEVGDVIRARWGQGDDGLLILSHMDTVWDVGTVTGRPTTVEDGKLYGVGSMDMKGGIVIALWALRALREHNVFPDQQITYLLNSDEETGSQVSGGIIEEEALKHRAVFVTEPPEHGAYKTARKGVSSYRVTATGRAAHAGAEHAQGVNAIEELARQILIIQGMTDYEIGTTANVGVVEGGTRGNVVPAQASAQVNVRATTRANAIKIDEQMHALKPHHPEATIEVEGGIGVPPMERTPEIAALFKQAQSLAREMGIEITEGSTGGGSDGNRTAALGVPTFDGMGVVGEGGHSIHEYAVIDSLSERAAIMAAMLRTRGVEA